MKKITTGFISILLIAFMCLTSFGQNQYLQPVNQDLRHIFSQLTYPDNNVKFLYERSAKMSDSVFYQNNCNDTSSMHVWNLLYEEMFYAAHDTLSMTPLNTVLNYSSQFYGDTVVMALMDYDFYHCVPNSLSTGDYFVFDTINNHLLDHNNAVSSPYGQSNIFAAAAMKENSYFTDPVFRIDPHMFFTDNINQYLYTGNESIRINFDDGTGWHYFEMGVLSHYQADYSINGRKTIEVQLFDSQSSEQTIKSSTCSFEVMVPKKSTPPDEKFIQFPGIEVGAYYSCIVNDEPGSDKVIIYLEGFDPLDFIPGKGNSIEMNYDKMINSKYIDELRNFNYSYYVVNFDKSTLDLRINAMHVLNLIEFLKNKYQFNDEQFVVIGHSMGGVIGRFLLTYMESEAYINADFTPFSQGLNDFQSIAYKINLANNHQIEFEDLGTLNRNEELVGQMHKVRTLITLDSPHQGANIPVSIQHSYKKLTNIIPIVPIVTYAFNILLDSKAAKQLLIYHIDASPGASYPNSYGVHNYQAHPARIEFTEQLADMGNYPKFCKLIAHSSADMGGENQLNPYNNVLRNANDNIADFEVELKARVLWIPRSLAVIKFNLRTNPNGSGLVYQASIGRYFHTLNVYWFGIGVQTNYLTTYNDNQYALNTKPYCTRAAGYYSSAELDNLPNNQWSLSGYYLLNLASWNTSVSNSCFYHNAHVGWNGFASVNTDLSFCTDGLHFGFVPLQSALDYGNGLNLPLNHDVQNENINTKLSRTPFDLIIGYTDGRNHDHSEEYYDPLIYNVTGQAAPNCGGADPTGDNNWRYAYYDADLQDSCEVKRSLMCLEIGDEQMYLENWTLNRDATFQTQYDLLVNERNPYYRYPSQNPIQTGYDGIYSKEAPFIIASSGSAIFKTGATNTPSNTGFVYNNNFSGPWDFHDEEMEICTNDYAEGKSFTIEEETEIENNEVYAKLYPNPNNGQSLMLEYDFLSDDKVNVQLFEVSGKKVFEIRNLTGGANSTALELSNLDSGMYLVNVFNASKRKVIRLIIH